MRTRHLFMILLIITGLLAGSTTTSWAENYRLGIPGGKTSPTYSKLFVALESRGLVVGSNLQIVPIDLSSLKTEQDYERIRQEIAARCDLFFTTGSLLPSLLLARIKTPLLFVSFNNKDTMIPPEMQDNTTGFFRGHLATMFTGAVKILPPDRQHKLGLLFFQGSSLQKKAAIYRKICKKNDIELLIKTFADEDDLDRVMHEFQEEGSGAVLILPPSLHNDKELATLVKLQNRLEMPVISVLGEHVKKGALGGFTVDYSILISGLADYAAKILRGRPAGKLPIKQLRDKYVINLGTVSQLGLVIPQEIIDQARIVGTASNYPKKATERKTPVAGNYVVGVAKSIPKPIIKHLLDSLADRGYREGLNLHLLEIDLAGNPSEQRQKAIVAQLAKETNLLVTNGINLPQLVKLTQLTTPVCFIATQEFLPETSPETWHLFTGVVRVAEDSLISRSRAMIPNARHMGIIAQANNNLTEHFVKYNAVAAKIGIALETKRFSTIAEIGPLMTDMKQRNDYILLLPPSVTTEEVKEIVSWQNRLQLPVIGQMSSHIEAGLLGGSIVNQTKVIPKMAEYIDKLLQGRPAKKLPIFQYTDKYMINLHTAANLDQQIPEEITRQAMIVRELQP